PASVGASIVINGNTTVTAVWEDLPTMHAVSFNANGGTGSKEAEQVEHGTYFTLPENPFTALDGKEFAGWAFTANGSKIEAATIQVNNNVTLFALWKDAESVPVDPVNPDEPGNPDEPDEPGNPDQPEINPVEEKGGLSGGAIAGIVIGSVAVVGLGGFSLLWFVIKKKSFADLIAVFKKK
ncbi:MAG: InlB B-repeat-containing protein, partial [Clostridia bacterium]|nr:InlB B-repeat-containing protein [Clostridia bacterium]